MSAVQKSGFVSKEGGNVASWKRRFLVIEKDKLVYYTNEKKKEKKGEIPFSSIKDVKLVKDYRGKKYTFVIITTTGRNYPMQGSDDDNVLSWVNAILQASGKSVLSTQQASAEAIATIVQPANPAQGGDSDESEEDGQTANAKKVGLEDFQQLRVVGRGGFGKVMLVRKKDSGKVYAMKQLKKDVIAQRGEIEHTKTERSVMARLDHPFLAKLHWSFQTGEDLYFVMDFINGGELFFHLSKDKRFSEERTRFYAAEIVSGVEHLHQNGIIYRDLKPENILLSAQGHIILTDFGLSKEGLKDKNDTTSTFCGTPEYLAPEIIQGKDYTKAIDWWSVGTLIYEMLTGLPPFYSDDEENMYRKIMTSELVFPATFSEDVKDLIKKLLTRDPNSRLQDPELIKAHPWFKSIDWVKLDGLQIAPPFKPTVKSADDISNVDDEFLNEDVNAPDEVDPDAKGAAKRDAFIGFTFAGNDDK